MSSGTPTPALELAPQTSARRGRESNRTVACAAVAAAMISVAGLPALAEPVTASVVVVDSIALRNLTESFTITGAPGTTQTADTAVTMNVLTNNAEGYSVTVEGATDTLVPTPANGDTIPVTDLQINGGDLADWTSVPGVTGTPLAVAGETVRSGATGDNITTNFRMTIPNVAADTYTGVLNFVASAL